MQNVADEEREGLLHVTGGPEDLESGGGPKNKLLPFVLTVLVCSGSVGFGYQLGFSSPLSALTDDERDNIFGSKAHFDFFASIATIGAMIGGLVAGPTADRFSVGVVSLTVPLYIAETVPVDLRGTLGGGAQLGVTIGILLVYVVGLPISHDSDWWRYMALIGNVPIAIQFIGMLYLPETPRWLLQNGHSLSSVEAALRKLRGPTADVMSEVQEIRSGLHDSTGLLDAAKALCTQANILQQATGVNSVIFYSGNIFKEAIGKSFATQSAALVGAVQVVMTFVSCVLMDRAGRKPLLLTACVGMGVSLVVLALCFLLDLPGFLAVVAVCLYISFFSLAMGPIPWLIMAEVFDNQVRGVAMALATVVNWLCAFAIVQCTSSILAITNPPWGGFFIYAGACGLAFLYIVALVPETKGKTLEQIQKEFGTATRRNS